MNSSEYSYHTTGTTVSAIEDHVIIDVIESTGERVVNGLIIPGEDSTERGIRPRWAHIHAVGPKQLEVTPGLWALVKNGEWTRGTLINGKVYRRVNPKEILLVSETKPEDVLI